MIDIRTHTHTDGLPTEEAAARRAARGSRSMKAQILDEMELLGYMTPDLFVEYHGGLINTVRRRFTDLWKEGKIRHHPTGLTRKNAAGNDCIYWVMGTDPDLVLADKPKLTAEYRRGFEDGLTFALNMEKPK